MFLSQSTWHTIYSVSLLFVFFCVGLILGAYLISKRNEKTFFLLSEHLTEKQKQDIVIKTAVEGIDRDKEQ